MAEEAGKRSRERIFDHALEALLFALLAVVPALYGGIHRVGELALVGLAGLIGLVLAAKLAACPRARFHRSWVYLPIVGFLGLVALQLVPLPASILGIVSPRAAELWSAAPGNDGAASISLYPNGTWRELRVLLAVAVVFAAVHQGFRASHRIRRLLIAVTAVGAAAAALFFVQRLAGAEKLYGLLPASNAPEGPFVNHNHFTQFMNLSVGAGLGLLLVLLDQRARNGRRSPYPSFLAPETRNPALVAAFLVLGALAVALSLSRGGAIALVVAAVVVGLLMASHRGSRVGGFELATIALAIFGLFAVTGLSVLLEQLGLLMRPEHGSVEIRWQQGWDLLSIFADFPAFGIGLGALEYVYPLYERLEIDRVVRHADVHYPSILAQSGGMGMALVVAFVGLVARAAVRVLRHRPEGVDRCIYGLVFGILAILLQSAVDYGQRMPANAVFSAVLFALIAVVAERPTEGRSSAASGAPKGGWRSLFRLAAPALVLALFLPLTMHAARDAMGQWYARRASRIDEQIDRNPPGPPQLHRRLLRHARAAVGWAPQNVRWRSDLVEYRLTPLLYRVEAEGVSLPEAKELTGGPAETARRLAAFARATRALAPAHARPCEQEGRIRYLLGQKERGRALIDRAVALDPHDPSALYRSGLLAADGGNWQKAIDRFRRAAAVDGDYFKPAAHVLIEHAPRPEKALRLTGGDTGRQLRLLRELEKAGHFKAAAAARARLWQRLEDRFAAGNADARDIRRLARLRYEAGNHRAAAKAYAALIEKQPGHAGWRARRGRALMRAGQFAEAERAFRAAVQLNPDHGWAKRGLERAERAQRGERGKKRPGSIAEAEKTERLRRIREMRARAKSGELGPEKLVLLARLERRADQPKRAAEHLAQAIEQNPDRSDWRIERARALREAGFPEQALGALRRCLARDPENRRARRLLTRWRQVGG